MWTGWYFISGIVVLAVVAMYLLICDFRNFNREERAYKERQDFRRAIIERGLQDAERDGVEIIPIPPFDKIKE